MGVNLQTMETLKEANAARQQRTSEIISETINADLAQLAVEYNSLSTVYQSFMYQPQNSAIGTPELLPHKIFSSSPV